LISFPLEGICSNVTNCSLIFGHGYRDKAQGKAKGGIKGTRVSGQGIREKQRMWEFGIFRMQKGGTY